jgi:hypothetical protein
MTTAINWTDFWPSSRADLADGDIIVLDRTANAAGVNGVEIMVRTPENITFFKSVRLLDSQGHMIGPEVIANQPNGTDDHTFSMQQIQSVASIEIWKGKIFNVPTPMYKITNLAGMLTHGAILDFLWVQDDGHRRGAAFHAATFGNVRAQDNTARTFEVDAGANFTLETRVLNQDSTIIFDPMLDFIIGSQNPQDNTTWGPSNRWPLSGRVLVNNGLNVVLNLKAPNAAGAYPLSIKMVQDGVEWFGGTLDFTGTVVGNVTTPASPGTCVLTALTVSLAWLAQVQPGLLDAARTTRAQLMQSEPGARLVELYYAAGRSGAVQAVLARNPALQWQCLMLAREINALAGKLPSDADLPAALADSAPKLAARADGFLARLADESPRDEARLLQEARGLIQNWGRNT